MTYLMRLGTLFCVILLSSCAGISVKEYVVTTAIAQNTDSNRYPDCNLPEKAFEHFPLEKPSTIWPDLLASYGFEALDNKRIRTELKWFKKHPNYLERVTQRGEPYLYHISQRVRARGLPAELALLPIVESAFDPFAYSPGRASGIWQFIPGTGKAMGLKQNWWYDGRRDILASTEAALDYLVKLNKLYDGDWLMALAAYNSGSGNVAKAKRKNKKRGKPLDYWSLDLPSETRAYVPRLIALSKIVQQPSLFNQKLYPVANQSFFKKIDTPGQIDLAYAAEIADTKMDMVYRLNPGFNHWATDPEGPHHLLIPVEKADIFSAKLSASPDGNGISWSRYTIKRGDTLSEIANRHKISVKSLQAVNQLNSHTIRSGKTLLIPLATQNATHYSLSMSERLKKRHQRSAKKNPGKRVDYTVKRGDSLWLIAKNYRVETLKIARWNNMAPADAIHPGQKLAIWTNTTPTTRNSKAQLDSQGVVRKVAYKVRHGDSLHRIADKFQLRVNDILRWNALNTKKYLQPGQSITLFIDVTKGIN